jgi:hypothetical protein
MTGELNSESLRTNGTEEALNKNSSNTGDSSSFYDRQYRHYEADDIEVNLSMKSIDRSDEVDDTDDDLQIETVALEYDIGITKETKLCSRWCRRIFCIYPVKCCGHTFGICCKKSSEEIGDGLEDKPSNEELLTIAFVSFLTFTICQAIAGYLANSKAMIGDSMAMAVDAFTYGFNLIAERMKYRTNTYIPCFNIRYLETTIQIQHDNRNQYKINAERWNLRTKRKVVLLLELIPPMISVTTLAIVTGVILNNSISVLILNARGCQKLQIPGEDLDPDEAEHPNIKIMFVFSFINVMVDAINVMFFSKADHAFGYNTFDEVELNQEVIGHEGILDYENDDDIHESFDDDDQVALSEKPPGATLSTPSKKKGAKKQIVDSFNLIIRDRKRRRGGAYAHVGTLNEETSDSKEEGENSEDENIEFVNSDDNIELTTALSPSESFTIDDDGIGYDGDSIRLDIPPSPLHLQQSTSIDEVQDEEYDIEYKGPNERANLNMVSKLIGRPIASLVLNAIAPICNSM